MAGDKPLVGVVAADAKARHGVWNEPVVLAPVALVQALQDNGARVLMIPSAPEPTWEPVHDRLQALVVQAGDDDFGSWFQTAAEQRELPVAHFSPRLPEEEWEARARQLVAAAS